MMFYIVIAILVIYWIGACVSLGYLFFSKDVRDNDKYTAKRYPRCPGLFIDLAKVTAALSWPMFFVISIVHWMLRDDRNSNE